MLIVVNTSLSLSLSLSFLPVFYVVLIFRYLERIIRVSELEGFAALLAPHQKALTADGEFRKETQPAISLSLSLSLS